MPSKLDSLLALGLAAGFGMLAGGVALAATIGPTISSSPRVSVTPSMTITPRINPNYHYDRVRLPPAGGGDKTTGDQPPRKIIKVDPSGPSGLGPSGPSGRSQPAGRAARSSNVPAVGERRFVPNEVLITLGGKLTEQGVDALARRHRLTRMESQTFQLTNQRMFRWQIPDGRSVPAVIRALQADGILVQPNHVFTLGQSQGQNAAQADPAQYTSTKLRLSAAHGLARGGNILVAVIDSGIDTEHPELAGVVVDRFDPADADAPHVHGTAIAGAIASHSRIVGAAPAAQILAVRAFGVASAGAEGTTFNILKSLDWSAGKGARIINMSFAGPRDGALEKALAAARQKGIVLIAAAGNAGPKSPPLYPAADPNVIAVSATDADDKLFAASNRGPHIAVAAPGVDLLLPAPAASYQVTSGTSFSAAYVSGVVALMLERNPALSPDAVRKILMASSKDLGPKGRDEMFGAGLIDAFQAVTAAEPKTTTASGQPQR
jgi:hypothetical protein